MAAAAFAIRDAKVPAEHIHILEELNVSWFDGWWT